MSQPQIINMKIDHARAYRGILGKKVIALFTASKPNDLHQSDCLVLSLNSTSGAFYQTPQLPVIELPMRVDQNSWRVIVDATTADGITIGENFNSGIIRTSQRCSHYAPILNRKTVVNGSCACGL